jgi:hypothetical protein
MQDLNDKITGNTLTAAEWNEVPSELQNVITAFQSLSGGDLDQLGKAIAGYAAAGDWYTGGGAADVYIATKTASLQAPPQYNVGQTVRLRPTANNTGASTINVNALGVKNIKKEDGTALEAGDIVTTRDLWIRYDGTDFLLLEAASSSIDIAAASSPAEAIGTLVYLDDSTVTLKAGVGGNLIVNIAGTKLTQAADLDFILDDFGVGGSHLDTGSEASQTPYYLYIDNDGGAMAAVISVDAPIEVGLTNAGYHPVRTDERYIGSIWNDVGQDIVPFVMSGNKQMFLEHDSNHEHALSLVASTSWRNLPLNIPETASAVLFSANIWKNGNGASFYGPDGAVDTISGSTKDITSVDEAMFICTVHGANQPTGSSADGEIPIVDRSAPAISYGASVNLSGHNLVVRGYVDMWAIH